jgi:phosphopantothenoylcysteine decarboxylase / phosphopantothenate---cysteine ligase
VHPSRAIRGRKSQLLAGRHIVVGISGSIAAVELPRAIRELIRHGAEVRAVMSPDAVGIVTPEAIAFATGTPPILRLTGQVEHVALMGPGEGRADLLLLAPATANTISKIAQGIDDTAVTSFASIALGGGVPVLIAPAMHAHMGQNPAIRENLARLRSWGAEIITPQAAEGEEKLASPEELAAAVLHRLARGPWPGRKVVVIGGAARESIDSVRSVTNESTGETAVQLAVQAHYRGAEVQLWASPLEVPIPSFLHVERWRSVADLRHLMRTSATVLAAADAVIVPAALSDYTTTPAPGKIQSRDHPTLTLTLTRAPKVLPELRRRVPAPHRLVGFKLLADGSLDWESEARRLLEETGADWVVVNERRTMGGPSIEALVLTRRGEHRRLNGPKSEVAGKLLDDLGQELTEIVAATGEAGARSHRPRTSRRRPLRPRSAPGGRAP